MKGKDGIDDGGIRCHLFFYAKDREEYERKSDMELHGSPMASQCLSRQIGDLVERKGDYAQAPEEDGMVIPLCDI
jgi:hypothetical protein